MKAKLLITNGSMSGIKISIDQKLSIGRSKNNGLLLKDDGIAQNHCRIYKKKDYYYLEQLDDKYPTLVNNIRVKECKLDGQDSIKIGSVLLEFIEHKNENFVPIKTQYEDKEESFEDFNCANDDERRIGDYIVLDHIGSGATGDVFKAEHLKTHQKVALKILHAQELDKNVLKRFLQEVQICGEFNHPKIVKVHEFGMFENRPLIVMEYVKGTSLDVFIKENGPFSAMQSLRIAGQIAQGLHYTHQKGVIHRDLKPSNILLEEDRKNIKIIDFGVIKVYGNSITFANQMIGTIRYIPPEQIDDASSVDERADIYSLGAVIYHLVTGNPPYFHAEGIESLILNIHSEPLIPIDEIVPGSPKALCHLVETAMNKNIEKRFQNITEMFTEIVEVLKKIDPNLQKKSE